MRCGAALNGILIVRRLLRMLCHAHACLPVSPSPLAAAERVVLKWIEVCREARSAHTTAVCGRRCSMAPAPLFSRPFDIVMVLFFVSHIPITILIDSQAIFPRRWYPEGAVRFLDSYVDAFGDPLASIGLSMTFALYSLLIGPCCAS